MEIVGIIDLNLILKKRINALTWIRVEYGGLHWWAFISQSPICFVNCDLVVHINNAMS